MPSSAAQAFMDGLQQIEQSRDSAALVRLFAAEAELENPARNAEFHGTDGARRFWQDYLAAFDTIRSHFNRVTEGERFAALEWRSDGRLAAGGAPVSYRGISLIQFDDDGRVVRFSTYYDSAAFLPQGAKHAERAAAAAETASA